MDDEARLLDSGEVAARLGVSRSRVRQLALAGALPARKLGRDWFVAPAALAAYVATRPPRGRPVTTGARRDPPRA